MNHADIKDKILKGGKLAIERMLERKAKEGSYVVVSQIGKLVKLSAKDIKK